MGKLFVVGTPIGNLKDMTYRAVETLKNVSFIACEDTRRTKILADQYGVDAELMSYHQHSKLEKIDWIIKRIIEGEDAAIVSDAGTPGVSDPGGVLVSKAVEAGIEVIPIPGVSALTTLVSVVGLPAEEFTFLGYLPKKKGRHTLLEALKSEKKPIVVYESPERIERTLADLVGVYGIGADVVIGRELTKVFEELIRGKLGDIAANAGKITKKGEFVLWISR